MRLLSNPYFFQLSISLTSNLKKYRDIISKELKSSYSGRTLDICCGTGNIASCVEGEYIGFDLNLEYINFAINRFKNDTQKKFLVSNINDFGFKLDYFDNVLLVNALHHFSDDDASSLLDDINKTAKRTIIITDPAIETKNTISKFLFILDRGVFIRSYEEQKYLISQKLNIVKNYTYYAGLGHGRIFVCAPKQ